MRYPLLALLAVVLPTLSLAADDDNLKLTPLFNGKDLAGWVPVNVAPNTFTVKEGIIHSTGFPTGILRTERQYENFVIELEWMHEKPAGNAGLFLWGDGMTAPGTPFARGIEVQILDDAYVQGKAREENWYTGHGDVFAIHGATMKPDRPHPQGWERCLPSENRANPAGQWNHYRVEAIDGVVKLSVNGKVVSGGTLCSPRKGYICLESEGSPAQFKNIRIAELPSTHPKPEQVAAVAEDFRSIYTGIDFTHWKTTPAHKGHWKPADWTMTYDGKAEGDGKSLWTEKSFGDAVMILDWRIVPLPADKSGKTPPTPPGTKTTLALRGGKVEIPLTLADGEQPGGWHRSIVTLKAGRLTVVNNGKTTIDDKEFPDVPADGPIGLTGDAQMEFANLFVRELK